MSGVYTAELRVSYEPPKLLGGSFFWSIALPAVCALKWLLMDVYVFDVITFPFCKQVG